MLLHKQEELGLVPKNKVIQDGACRQRQEGKKSSTYRKAKRRPSPEWVIDILKEGPDYDPGRSWTIYRVPRNMQRVHKNAYVPKLISIGPFYYGDRGLKVMEEHKMRYLWRLLGRRLPENGAQAEEPVPHLHKATRLADGEQAEDQQLLQVSKAASLKNLTRAMGVWEQKTRLRYSETFYMDSDDFVQMMVVDGCFVVELLRLYYKFVREPEVQADRASGSSLETKMVDPVQQESTVDDPIFTTRWMLRTLQRDLFMLENQLPFFVLEELFKLTSSREEPSLIDLTLTFFDPLLPRKKIIDKVNREEEFDHMLDVFRSTFLPSVQGKITTVGRKQLRTPSNIPLVEERQLIHCVTELQEAGVEFRMRKCCGLLDIKFDEHGVLEIPPLYIDDNTVPLFLNLVAYEQCDEDAKPFFTNFFMFFDSLINSPNDVEILHKNGIINHVLGSNKDVANLFNRLCREIVYDLDECYLSNQMKGVNDYCKSYYAKKYHVWWTNLIRDYFSSPWTFLSLLAAVVLLILTAAQTSYALIAYYRPPQP